MGIAFTQQVLIVRHVSNELAAQHQQMIGTPHMLAAILNAHESSGYRLLNRLTKVTQLDSEIQSLISQQPRVQRFHQRKRVETGNTNLDLNSKDSNLLALSEDRRID